MPHIVLLTLSMDGLDRPRVGPFMGHNKKKEDYAFELFILNNFLYFFKNNRPSNIAWLVV